MSARAWIFFLYPIFMTCYDLFLLLIAAGCVLRRATVHCPISHFSPYIIYIFLYILSLAEYSLSNKCVERGEGTDIGEIGSCRSDGGGY